MTEEVWKEIPINGTENYKVSDQGRIIDIRTGKYVLPNKGGMVTLYQGKQTLWCVKKKMEYFVALTFIPNPEYKSRIIRKEKDHTNNRADNLKWATIEEYSQYHGDYRPVKAVEQFDESGKLIKKYASLLEVAKETGKNCGTIRHAIKCGLKLGDYFLRYSSDKPLSQVPDGVTIKEYPGYVITKEGRIFCLKGGDYLYPRKTSVGGRKVMLFTGETKKSIGVHHLVAKAYIPNPDNYQYICHKDGNKSNNHFENITWSPSRPP